MATKTDKAKEIAEDTEAAELEEQVSDADFGSAFSDDNQDEDEGTAASPKKEDEGKDNDGNDEGGDKNDDDDDTGKTGNDDDKNEPGVDKGGEEDGDKDDKKGDEETASEKLERLAKESESSDTSGNDNDKGDDSQAKQEPITIGDDFIDNAVENIPDEDKKTQVKEALNEFPEWSPLLLSLAQMLTGNVQVKSQPDSQDKGGDNAGDQDEDGNKQAAQPQSGNPDPETARRALLYECEEQHPGSIKTANSPEFQQWLKEQSSGVQALADSGDVNNAVTVIQAYLESNAKKAANDHDSKTAGKRNKKNDLHKSTATPKDSGGTDDDTGADDFGSSFEEEAGRPD